MKFKNIYSVIILFVTTLVLAWAIPVLVKKATMSGQNYPFVYYSSLLQDFAIKKTENRKVDYYDSKGNTYTREEYDSITPLLSYRQLTLAGTMPDSILGVEMDPRMLRVKSVMWRYSPSEISKPLVNMYLMYEALSGRSTLESPPDVFRLDDKIEFIDKESNLVDEKKSEAFQSKMEERGFAFPAKGVWGNPVARKPYDEGYFVLDNNGELFHIKQVNGRPYVGNTKAGQSVDIAYFSLYEIADKSIYGFVISKTGEIYTVSAEGGYELTKLDIAPIDIHKHSVMMLGNMFYWMINVTGPEGCTYNVLSVENKLKKHTEPYFVGSQTDKWDATAKWLLPVYISFDNKNTEYVKPEIVVNFGYAFLISLVLAVIFVFTIGKQRNTTKKIINGIFILIFGIPAFIASAITK